MAGGGKSAGILQRTADLVRRETAKRIRMDVPGRQMEQTIVDFREEDVLSRWIVGCDADIGGFSTATLEKAADGTGVFHGNMSTKLPENKPDIVQSGYAACKLREPGSTLFGTPYIDTVPFRYFATRVRADHRNYYVNVQTAGPVQTDLFQHRLFTWTPGEWETVLIPWRSFVLTNNGVVMKHQIEMMREKVRSIGFSVADRQDGPFRLEIAWIKAINTKYTDGDMDVV